MPPHAPPSTPCHPFQLMPPQAPHATLCTPHNSTPPHPSHHAAPSPPCHPEDPRALQGAGAGHGTHPDTRGCCRSCSAGPAPGTPPGGGSRAGGAAPPRRRRRCRAPTGTTRPTAPLLQDRGSNVGARGDPDRPGGGDVTSTALLAVPAPVVAPAPPPRGERALGRTQLDHPHRTALHHAALHCTAQRYVALCGTALQRVEPRCTALHCTTLCHTAPWGTDRQLVARHGMARHCPAPCCMAQHRTAPH